MSETQSKTSGEWLYTQDAKWLTAVENEGWKPESHTGSKYGCGVYLSRTPWYKWAKEALVCTVDLLDDEVVDCFPALPEWKDKGSGNSEGHLARYLKHLKLIPNNRPVTSSGNSKHNKNIRDFLLGKRMKAVQIVEHAIEVLIVYDPTVIFIVKRRKLTK